MAKEQRIRATFRDAPESVSTPGQLNPMQPVDTGPRQSGLGRFLETLEAIEPNFRGAAQRHDKAHKEEQERMARADALADSVSGKVDLETAKQREAFGNPFYQDTYMTSRYSLMASQAHDDIQQGIAENQNKPDFDQDGYFRGQLQAVLSEVDDPEYKDIVAEKMGVLYGKLRQEQNKKALVDQEQRTMETLQASANDTAAALVKFDRVPDEQAFEDFRSQAVNLNRTETEAKEIWLQTMAQAAVERADMGVMDGLAFLADDPDFKETYEAKRRSVTTEINKRATYDETAFRDVVNQRVDNGTFTLGTVRSITENDAQAQYWTEAQLAAMLRQSQDNLSKGETLRAAPTDWLKDPTGFMMANGETLKPKEIQATLTGGLQQLSEIYQGVHPDNPGLAQAKAHTAFLTKLSQSGQYGTFDPLKSQFNTAGAALKLTDGVEEPPEEFLRMANLYNNIQQLGGGSLLKNHITDETASKVFATYHRYTTQTDMAPAEAYYHTATMLENRVPLDEFRSTVAADKIDRTITDLASDVLPQTIRGPIKALALEYGAMGHDVDTAIDLARKDFEKSHMEVRGQWVRLGNEKTHVTPQTMRNASAAMELMVSDDAEFQARLKKQAGMAEDEELDPEDVTFVQHVTNPLVFIPAVNHRAIPSEALKVEDFTRYMASRDEKARAEAMRDANQRNDAFPRKNSDSRYDGANSPSAVERAYEELYGK